MVRKISAETRALLKVAREFVNLSYRELAKRYGVSKSVAHKVCNPKTKENSKPGRPGRPKVLCERSERKLLRTFFKLRRTSPNFSVKNLIVESGLDATKYCRRTVSRFLNKKGYKLRQARKKGLLSEKDLRIRRQYARNMKNVLKKYPNYFTNHIEFYLDGVSFIHKSDPLMAAVQPKSRVWRTKGEGLKFTAKGSKCLPEGKRLHLIVAIAYGKGVILKEPYEKMNGNFFYNFIKTHFNLTFGKAGRKAYRKRIFVMDNDPCQTSRKAMSAINQIECELHQIPARSPDLNPIENVFHLIKKKLEKDAIDKKIRKESFNEFKDRVLRSLRTLDSNILDRTIESMPKRVEAILLCNGRRIKY